jgi:GPH family glycoside/pentoside/hexuronide:cation symporter
MTKEQVVDSGTSIDNNDGTLPNRRILVWAVGGIGESLMANLILALAIPIYSVALGVNPAWIGLALSIPRFWDAITDPFMGNISDNTRSRWGRRRPYILIGAISTGILFMLLWTPPTGWSHEGLFIYFTIISILYYTAYTVFVVPYSALGFELSMDYNDRTKIQAARTFFSTLSGLALPWAYKLSFNPHFGSNELEGVKIVGVIFGTIMIIACVIPAIFSRENMQSQKQKKLNIAKAFLYTLKNKHFFLVAGINLFTIIGIFLVQPMGLYMGIFYLFDGKKEMAATLTGYTGTMFAAMGLLAIPFIIASSKKFGKRRTIIGAETIIIFAYLITWFVYTPKMPYLSLICFVFLCPGTSTIWTLCSSMLADVTDFDELNTGLRREGMYGAVYSWVFKAALAGSLGIAGVLLATTGIVTQIPEDVATVAQSYETEYNELKATIDEQKEADTEVIYTLPETVLVSTLVSEIDGLSHRVYSDGAVITNQKQSSITAMRVMYAIVPAFFSFLALLCAFFYPVTEKMAREIRAQLDAGAASKHNESRII